LRKVVSFIIPTLNEEVGLKKTLSSLPADQISQLGKYHIEIVVVDSNSNDSTRDVALAMGARVIVEKKGYGRAYKTGFSVSSGDFIVTLDADGTYPVEMIPAYIKELNEKQLDFITINRLSKLEKGSMSIINKVGNKILSIAIRFLYSIRLKDSQSGMWIMKRSFLDSINIMSDNMSFSEEIKIIAFKFFRSAELDGKYYKRIGASKLNAVKDGYHNFKYLFQYKRQLKFAVRSLHVVDKNI